MAKYLATVVCNDADIYITSLGNRGLELIVTGPPSLERVQSQAELTKENVDELLGVLTEWRKKVNGG